MSIKSKISTTLAIAIAIVGFKTSFIPSTFARELSDGTVFFEKAPRLLDAFTYSTSAKVWGAKYYFIIELPEAAGEPLQKVVIQQRIGFETIRFRLEATSAFLGTPNQKGNNLSIKAVENNPSTKEITVIFDPPIAPGSIFTVALKPRRNPSFGGIYLLGVTVFPAGDRSYGLYLGPGRFHFYEPDRYRYHRYRRYPINYH